MPLNPELINPSLNANVPDDNYLGNSSVNQSPSGTELGLVVAQLKIITLILRQAFNITDEDISLCAPFPQVLNPPLSTSNQE